MRRSERASIPIVSFLNISSVSLLPPMAWFLFFVASMTWSPGWDGVCGENRPIGRVVDVMSVDGQPVELRRSGSVEWMPVTKGADVCVGDQVRTRFRSRSLIRLATAGGGFVVDIVVGVNARVRTTGGWGDNSTVDDTPLLEIVHGVVRLRTDASGGSGELRLQTGPTTCALGGGEVVSNWDPFKAEANHLLLSGELDCTVQDSVIAVSPGKWLEVVRGTPGEVRYPAQLIEETLLKAASID